LVYASLRGSVDRTSRRANTGGQDPQQAGAGSSLPFARVPVVDEASPGSLYHSPPSMQTTARCCWKMLCSGEKGD